MESDQPKLRNLSPRQKEIVRRSLALIREHGGPGVDAAALHWTEFAEEICRLTHPSGTDFIRSKVSAIASRSTANYQNVGERLRRFVEGEPVGSGSFPEPEEPLATQMIEYLLHPKVAVLSREALISADVGYLEGKIFSEFLWQQTAQDSDKYVGLSGTYVSGYLNEDRRFINCLEFQNSGHPYFAFVREMTYNTELRVRTMRRNGWAAFTSDGEVLAFLVEVGTSIVESLFGQIYDLTAHENSAQVFFNGVPTTSLGRDALSLAQAYVNSNFRINAREPRQLFGKWSETEGEKIRVYKYLGDTPLGEPAVYDILLPGSRRPSWGSKRFFNESKSTTEVFVNNDKKNDAQAVDAEVPELIVAFKECDRPRFEALVREGADVNCQEPRTKLTPLHYAAILGREFELEILRTRDDLDVLVRDHKGHLPSSHAVGLEDSRLFLELVREELEEARRRGLSPHDLHIQHAPGLMKE